MPRISLTNEFLKTGLVCPPGKQRIEYCDAGHPGLYIECRDTSPGNGTFYLRYKNTTGKTCHQKLGRTHELTLAQARKRAKALKAEILLGADPRAEAKVRKAMPTFADFFEHQYKPYASRIRSYRNIESMYRLRLKAEFGDLPLDQISRQKIQAMHTALREQGFSGATSDHHVKMMRTALNVAVSWGLLDRNPATRIPLFLEDNRVEHYLTDEELARLLSVLQTHNARTVCHVVMFLLSTGARLNEALKASWKDIDTETRVWRIPASNSKSKRIRSVPLNDAALEVLAQLPKREGQAFLFRSRQTGKRLTTITRVWMRIRKEAGLPNLRLHDLRHQFASFLVNSGRSLYEVQQILGHSDPTVTQRYSHLSTQTLQEAAQTATARLNDALALAG